MKKRFFAGIDDHPIIAAVRDGALLTKAIESPCRVIFLLQGGIFNLAESVKLVQASGKEIYVHFDLLEGFSRDMVAMTYISQRIGPDGIITTKSSLVKAARDIGLFVIQRLFILDSQSVETGIRSVLGTRPDAVEIMPGLIPRAISSISSEVKVPIIAGGLIATKEDVVANLKAGALAVSVSRPEIWHV